MKQNELNVALIQGHIVWHDPAANRDYYQEKIKATAEVDLFVLPEMFSTGFTMDPAEVAEGMDGETVTWMRKMASDHDCAITGSVVISDAGKFYNRLIFVTSEGAMYTYDKRHLFSLAGEDNFYSAGKNKLVLDYKGWRICPLVCYDLRFPVFARNSEDYEVLIFVANWPEPRIDAWDLLLPARAVENMSYVIGVNRIGTDQNENHYVGHSQVIDPIGKYLLSPGRDEGVIVTTLKKTSIHGCREKYGFLSDRDEFKVI